MFITENNSSLFDRDLVKAKAAILAADAIIIGAGAGLSTSAGFTYSGERFKRYFDDFARKYHFSDMYSGGFFSFSSLEEYWAYWSRYIFINRYINPPKDVYQTLLSLVKDKNYFVITTNVDHQFQKAGFHKNRLFYTQGDYGLFQCSKPCHKCTYDNEETIRKMVLSQDYEISSSGELLIPTNSQVKMSVPTSLIPICPKCGAPMSMNLRADDTFVEDDGWKKAYQRYEGFLRNHLTKKILFLELGVGFNTPIIIKYPFWRWTESNPNATYISINVDKTICPESIRSQSICFKGDIGEILGLLK